jgi:hypothetical protein
MSADTKTFVSAVTLRTLSSAFAVFAPDFLYHARDILLSNVQSTGTSFALGGQAFKLSDCEIAAHSLRQHFGWIAFLFARELRYLLL